MNVQFEKYISKTLEAKCFKNAFEYFFTIIEDFAQELGDNLFIKSSNISFIQAWEKFLSIARNDTLTLDERRSQVLLTKLSRPPFTRNSLIQQIRGITGIDNEITEDELNLSFNIDLTGSSQFVYKMVNDYMRKVKPCNVTYSISTTIPNLEENNIFYMVTFVTKCIVV